MRVDEFSLNVVEQLSEIAKDLLSGELVAHKLDRRYTVSDVFNYTLTLEHRGRGHRGIDNMEVAMPKVSVEDYARLYTKVLLDAAELIGKDSMIGKDMISKVLVIDDFIKAYGRYLKMPG